MILKNICFAVIMVLTGICAGAVTASGLFALISGIGLINRYADVTHTRNKILLYEECIIAGATIGNVTYLFNLSYDFGRIGCILVGCISGIFIGTFLVCLAETVKGLPIFSKRMMIGKGLGFAILFLATGKLVGQLIYYLYLYK